jgi:hypothetical protein
MMGLASLESHHDRNWLHNMLYYCEVLLTLFSDETTYSLPSRLGVQKTFRIVLNSRQQKQTPAPFLLGKVFSFVPSSRAILSANKWRLLMLANETRTSLCH